MAKQKKADPKPAAPCPVSREAFHGKAPVLMIDLGDGEKHVAKFLAPAKDFSTGSFGWGVSEKFVVMIDGKPVKVQASINLAVVGSKLSEPVAAA